MCVCVCVCVCACVCVRICECVCTHVPLCLQAKGSEYVNLRFFILVTLRRLPQFAILHYATVFYVHISTCNIKTSKQRVAHLFPGNNFLFLNFKFRALKTVLTKVVFPYYFRISGTFFCVLFDQIPYWRILPLNSVKIR